MFVAHCATMFIIARCDFSSRKPAAAQCALSHAIDISSGTLRDHDDMSLRTAQPITGGTPMRKWRRFQLRRIIFAAPARSSACAGQNRHRHFGRFHRLRCDNRSRMGRCRKDRQSTSSTRKAACSASKMDVVVEDNRSEPQEAVTSYRKMMSSDNANVFISGCLSAGNFAAIPIVMRQKTRWSCARSSRAMPNR